MVWHAGVALFVGERESKGGKEKKKKKDYWEDYWGDKQEKGTHLKNCKE